MKKILASGCGALLFTTISCAALASETPEQPDYSGNLTGDWGGVRSKLSNKGIDVDLVYTADFWSNVSGGVKRRGQVLDNTDLIFNIDGEKLYGLKGSTISLYFLNNNGGKPNEDVGSIQGVDNIEVEQRTAKLFEAWIEQKFANDTASVRAGLYNLNSEFYVTDSSAIFLNPTFGIGTDFAQTGQNGPSIFPTSSMAVRAAWQPMEKLYIQAAVLDGVPGDPHNPQGTHVQFNNDDGELYVAEAGYSFESTKIGLGGWYYTEKFDDLIEVDGNGDPLKRHNQGIYAIAETQFCEKISGFARLGFADDDVNQSDIGWALGVNINKLIPGRDDGVLGFAVSGVHNSDKYEESTGNTVDSNETNLELTYSDNLTPWLMIQPDVQYTINPGTDPALDDSLLFGLRFKISF